MRRKVRHRRNTPPVVSVLAIPKVWPMTNREIAHIVKDQQPLALPTNTTVREACRAMTERGTGSVLVVDADKTLKGIFTGRDAVRFLAKAKDPAAARLGQAMRKDPVTITPGGRAVDALRAMNEGGFRHMPVVEDGRIWGVVSRGDFKGMEFERFARHVLGEAASTGDYREIAEIIRERKPHVMHSGETAAEAAKSMTRRKGHPVLVIDARGSLKGIFTGRDAVRLLAKAKDPASTLLSRAMTKDPVHIHPAKTAVDALRLMHAGGFRHVVVVDDGAVCGCIARADLSGPEIDRLEEEVHLWETIR